MTKYNWSSQNLWRLQTSEKYRFMLNFLQLISRRNGSDRNLWKPLGKTRGFHFDESHSRKIVMRTLSFQWQTLEKKTKYTVNLLWQFPYRSSSNSRDNPCTVSHLVNFSPSLDLKSWIWDTLLRVQSEYNL